METIEKVLPPTVTGSIALVIGISLAGTAMTNALGASVDNVYISSGKMLTAAAITLISTVLFSVYLKGVWGQLPILFGILAGYVVSIPLGLVEFSGVFAGNVIEIPHFTLPAPSLTAVLAIMPIAIATIPESTAHLFQLDIYVNDLSKKKGKGDYKIAEKLGLNLIGDGIGDIVASLFGGPAGTNYGENISTMAITKNFSVRMLGAAAIMAMLLSFIRPLSGLINTVPGAVVNGACVFLFGVIAAQGIAIMINKNVDMFDAKNLAVIAIIMIIGLGGHYGFANGMIPIFGAQLPAIATASIVGILLNAALSIGKKEGETSAE
jgi:uracil permease